MEIKYSVHPDAFKRFTTSELRNNCLIENLFQPNALILVYAELERAIVGSAVPTQKPLSLVGSKKELGSEFFLERRELGIINIGSLGSVIVDGTEYVLNKKDGLYIGKGVKEVLFKSELKNSPSQFYIVSYPAHKEYPSQLIKYDSVVKAHLGTVRDCNVRTINKYIHPDGVHSCQLVMGLTELEEGSIWNTMPCHTHQRRSEVYLYFNISDDSFVVHLMGAPDETRHIIMHDKQAVINPSWSIHSGAGMRNYSFIWAMGGENQIFDDMDWVDAKKLK